MAINLTYFETKLQTPTGIEESVKNSLAEYLFPDTKFAVGHIYENSTIPEDLQNYHNLTPQFSNGEKVYFASHEIREKIYPTKSDGAAYGSLAFTPCKEFKELSTLRILIIDDETGENGGLIPNNQAKKLVGDCYGRMSPDIAKQLTGTTNTPFQFRLGIKPQTGSNVHRIAKGTLAPARLLENLGKPQISRTQDGRLKTKIGYDLVLATSSFKGRKDSSKIEPGEHTLTVGIGIKTLAEYGKHSLGTQILVNYPQGVEVDILPKIKLAAQRLAAIESDPRKIAEYFLDKYERQIDLRRQDLSLIESAKVANLASNDNFLDEAYLKDYLWDSELQNIDLDKTGLQNKDLEDTDLDKTGLQNKDLESTNSEDTGFQNTRLQDTDFQNTRLQDTDFQNTKLQDTDLLNTSLLNTELQNTRLQNTRLQDTDFQNTKLQNTGLQNTKLQDTGLLNTELQNTKLQDNDFQNTKLQDTDFQNTKLQDTDLLNTELQNTKLQDTELQNTELQDTDLLNTELQNTKLQDTALLNTELQNTKLQDTGLLNTELEDFDLDNTDLEDIEQQYNQHFYSILKTSIENHPQLLEHPNIVSKLTTLIRREWVDIATGRAIKFQSGLAQPSLELKKNEISVPYLKEGEKLIVTRSPLINSNGVILLTNKHLPEFTNEKGTIHIHPETAAAYLQADFDGDRIAYEVASKYPTLTAEIESHQLPENRHTDIIKADKQAYIAATFGEIALAASSNKIGIIANNIQKAVSIQNEIDSLPEKEKIDFISSLRKQCLKIQEIDVNSLSIPDAKKQQCLAIQEKANTFVNLTNEIEEKTNTLANPINEIEEKTNTLFNPSNEIHEKTNTLANPINEIHEKANPLFNLTKGIHEKMNTLFNPSNEIEEKTNTLANPSNEIEEKTNTLFNPSNEIHEKTNTLFNPSNEIHEKTNTLANPINEIHEKTNTLANPINEIHEKTNTLANPTNEISEKTNTLPNLSEEENITAQLQTAKQIFFETVDILSNELQTAADGPKSSARPNEDILEFATIILDSREVAWIPDKKQEEPYSNRTMRSQNHSPIDKMIQATNQVWQENHLESLPTHQYANFFPKDYTSEQKEAAQKIIKTYNSLYSEATALKQQATQQPGPRLIATSATSGKQLVITNLVKYNHPDVWQSDNLNIKLTKSHHSQGLIALAEVKDNPNQWKTLGNISQETVKEHNLKAGMTLTGAKTEIKPGITPQEVKVKFQAARDFAEEIKAQYPTETYKIQSAIWHSAHASDQKGYDNYSKATAAFNIFPEVVAQQAKEFQFTNITLAGIHHPTNEWRHQLNNKTIEFEVAIETRENHPNFNKRVILVEGKQIAPMTEKDYQLPIGTKGKGNLTPESSANLIATTAKGNTLKIGQIRKYDFAGENFNQTQATLTIDFIAQPGRNNSVPVVKIDDKILGVIDGSARDKLKAAGFLRPGVKLNTTLQSNPATTAILTVDKESLKYPEKWIKRLDVFKQTGIEANREIGIGDSRITEIKDNLKAGIGDNLETGIGDNLETGIGDNLKTGIQDNLETGIGDNLKTGIQDNLKTGIQDNLKTGIQDNLKTGIQDNLESASVMPASLGKMPVNQETFKEQSVTQKATREQELLPKSNPMSSNTKPYKRPEWEKHLVKYALKTLNNLEPDEFSRRIATMGQYIAIYTENKQEKTLRIIDGIGDGGILYKAKQGEPPSIDNFSQAEKQQFSSLMQQNQQIKNKSDGLSR